LLTLLKSPFASSTMSSVRAPRSMILSKSTTLLGKKWPRSSDFASYEDPKRAAHTKNHMEAPPRRSFLRLAIMGLGSMASMMAAWGAARFALFSGGEKRSREIPADIVSRLPPNETIHVPEAGVWLTAKFQDRPLIILDDRCTHLGCRHRWVAEESLYRCPCHGSEFDRDGVATKGPATRPLPRLTLIEGPGGMLKLQE
jgi:cytochrome b6-f complex iron-sulfur subunit